MHIISLSFDDGFERSNLRIAEIYETFGLSACFNVLAFEEVDGEKVSDPDADIEFHDGMMLQVGRRKFARVHRA